jgi:hypothetical protein
VAALESVVAKGLIRVRRAPNPVNPDDSQRAISVSPRVPARSVVPQQ